MQMDLLRGHADIIIRQVIADNLPGKAVVDALVGHDFGDKRVNLVAIGKAAWTMAMAARDYLGGKIISGVVITKYGHSQGDIPGLEIHEAGHPVPDENTVVATQRVMELVEALGEGDEVLFLVSGGGSALFECPQDGVTLADLQTLTGHMLASGADITEINTIRKRLSKVKAGRFAQMCKPAGIFSVILSDVLGDRLDVIASGPAVADMSTTADALAIVEKYGLRLPLLKQEPKQDKQGDDTSDSGCDRSKGFVHLLLEETPKTVEGVETIVTGSVRSLCASAAACVAGLGYTPRILTTSLDCEAREAGRFLAAMAREVCNDGTTSPIALIAGGETVVHVKGGGMGGRNQELALAAAAGITGINNVLVFSLGSDGTDGPTDAAGGIVDGNTAAKLKTRGLDIDEILADNDSYNGLKAVGGLIITGPTGTNVNDLVVVLVG